MTFCFMALVLLFLNVYSNRHSPKYTKAIKVARKWDGRLYQAVPSMPEINYTSSWTNVTDTTSKSPMVTSSCWPIWTKRILWFSRYVEVKSLISTANAVTAVKSIFSRHGVLVILLTDNGAVMIWQNLLSCMGFTTRQAAHITHNQMAKQKGQWGHWKAFWDTLPIRTWHSWVIEQLCSQPSRGTD